MEPATGVGTVSDRPKVNKALKRRLVAEAGNKCANPGCSTVLTELHHIRQWHVVKTHDERDMIALCPACHAAATRGDLQIDDERAYAWKRVDRADDGNRRGHLYVEPTEAEPARLLLGSIGVMSATASLVVFSEKSSRRLSFVVSDLAIMNLDATVSDIHGRRLVRVSGGHYRAEGPFRGEVRQRAGHFRITHPWAPNIVPEWALATMRAGQPGYAPDNIVTLLAMEVVRPNLVRVEGIWLDDGGGMIIDQHGIHFVNRGRRGAVSLVGEGVESMLHCVGPVDTALFSRAPGQGILHVP